MRRGAGGKSVGGPTGDDDNDEDDDKRRTGASQEVYFCSESTYRLRPLTGRAGSSQRPGYLAAQLPPTITGRKRANESYSS